MDALEGIVANPTNRVYQSNIRHVPCGVVTDGALKCPIYSRNNPTLAANIILIGLIEMDTADKGYHIRERISILNTSGLLSTNVQVAYSIRELIINWLKHVRKSIPG